MSRRDNFHYLVKAALIRDGWTITHDPYTFHKIAPVLSTDLGAERTIAAEKDSEKIAVEIKSFLGASQIVDLEKAVGQYIIYCGLLRRQEPDRVLYLAVPKYAFEGVLSTEVGQITAEAAALKLIVFPVVKEEEELLWKQP